MEYIVRVENLVKRYDDLVAIDHLNLEIREGEVFGLLGPNGSGKSTLINCILSILKYDYGDIYVFGEKMSPDKRYIKQRIGLVPQDIAVYEELNVRENIDYFCSLYIGDKKKRRELVEEAIDFVKLQDFEKFHPSKLSGGLKRRLNLACGMAHKPDLLILDEPTVAVDPQSRNSILEGIKDLARKGTSIIYTTHYMEEVQILADRIAILDKGKLLMSGTNDEIIASSSMGERVECTVLNLGQSLLEEFRNNPGIASLDYDGRNLDISLKKGSISGIEVLEKLEEEGYRPLSFTSKKPSLNDVFLEITGKELRDHA